MIERVSFIQHRKPQRWDVIYLQFAPGAKDMDQQFTQADWQEEAVAVRKNSDGACGFCYRADLLCVQMSDNQASYEFPRHFPKAARFFSCIKTLPVQQQVLLFRLSAV